MATLGVVVGMLVVSAPSAGAVENTCRARNLTQGTPNRSNLQAAINAADRSDRIGVKGVCVGSFKIDKDLTLVGKPTPQDATPVLHGERGSGSVVRVAARVALTNLKVTGGVAKTDGDVVAAGGGILVRKGSALTLNRSLVRENKAWDEGGGIANHGRLILNGSTSVSGNRAGDGYDTGHGGGIANYGTLIMNGSSTVRGNTSANTGGGIRNYGRLIMNGSSSVRGNSTELGGGISLSIDHPDYMDPTVTMNDSSSVRRNTAESPSPGSQGIGGGFLLNEGTVTLKDSSSVSGNHAANGGGGLYASGTLILKGSSSVTGNTEGGIFNRGVLIMNDSSSVHGNTSENEGGGIENEGDITLKDSSAVFDNTATYGGGVYNPPNGTINACDATSVDEWIGTVEPNDPNDFLDSDVSLTPSGTSGCS